MLLTNVVDLKFVRRRLKSGAPNTRRMLCTKSAELLGSANGRLLLNYMPPTQPPKYQPSPEGLIAVWDIFMQDYRNIPSESVNIIESIPAGDEFWEKFNTHYRLMSTQDKINYMNS